MAHNFSYTKPNWTNLFLLALLVSINGTCQRKSVKGNYIINLTCLFTLIYHCGPFCFVKFWPTFWALYMYPCFVFLVLLCLLRSKRPKRYPAMFHLMCFFQKQVLCGEAHCTVGFTTQQLIGASVSVTKNGQKWPKIGKIWRMMAHFFWNCWHHQFATPPTIKTKQVVPKIKTWSFQEQQCK